MTRSRFARRLCADPRYRTVIFAWLSLIGNLLYAGYHGILGVTTHASWFIAMCAYHVIFAVMRFSAILRERQRDHAKEYTVMGLTGVLLVLLSMVLAGIVYMSVAQEIATKYGEIIMITIATYTFSKLTMAIIRAHKHRRDNSPVLSVIRGIGYAEIAVSVLTMQRSMLVSFEQGMREADIARMNLLTGIGVCLFTLALGIDMLRRAIKKR